MKYEDFEQFIELLVLNRQSAQIWGMLTSFDYTVKLTLDVDDWLYVTLKLLTCADIRILKSATLTKY